MFYKWERESLGVAGALECIRLMLDCEREEAGSLTMWGGRSRARPLGFCRLIFPKEGPTSKLVSQLPGLLGKLFLQKLQVITPESSPLFSISYSVPGQLSHPWCHLSPSHALLQTLIASPVTTQPVLPTLHLWFQALCYTGSVHSHKALEILTLLDALLRVKSFVRFDMLILGGRTDEL